jgi:transcriptional regulator with XRE-family HTH domain
MTGQTLGTLLRQLRRQRRLTQEGLATRAQVTARTLRYWEADQQQPRETELESVLQAVGATVQERAQILSLLTDRMSVRLARNSRPTTDVASGVLGSLPGTGDLLRAMWLRRGYTQDQLAAELGVSRTTIIRWEAMRTLPSAEDVMRLGTALNAATEEIAVLSSGRLLPSNWPPQLSLEQCIEQYEFLCKINSEHFALWPVFELYALALKRQLRLLFGQEREALRLLAKVELAHSGWLFLRGRSAEAYAGEWRALNLVRDQFTPEEFWLRLLNLLAAHVAIGERGAENGIKMLYPWLRLLPGSLHPELLCDLAYYAARAGHPEAADRLLKRAHHSFWCDHGVDPNRAWYYRMTKARVLLRDGQPIEALEWLPPLETTVVGSIFNLQIWAETYIAAGEREEAARCLTRLQELFALTPQPLVTFLNRQKQLEQQM